MKSVMVIGFVLVLQVFNLVRAQTISMNPNDDQISDAINKEDYNTAISLLEQEINRPMNNGESCIENRKLLGSCYLQIGQYDKVIDIDQAIIDDYKNTSLDHSDSIAYIQSVNDLASAYFELGNLNNAFALLENELENFPDNEYKLTSIQTLIIFYQRAGETDKWKQACNKSLVLAEKIAGKKSPLYANALLFAANAQEKKGDAILYLEEARTICEENDEENSKEWVEILSALYARLYDVKSYEENKALRESLLNKIKKIYGESSVRYYQELSRILYYDYNQHLLNLELGMFDALDKMESLLLKICEEYGMNSDLFLETAVYYSDTFMNDSIFDVSIPKMESVVENNLLMYGPNSFKYISSLESLARIKSAFSYKINYEKYTLAKELRKVYEEELNDKTSSVAKDKVFGIYKESSLYKHYQDVDGLLTIILRFYDKNQRTNNYHQAVIKLIENNLDELRFCNEFTKQTQPDVEKEFRLYYDKKLKSTLDLCKKTYSYFEQVYDLESLYTMCFFYKTLYSCQNNNQKASDFWAFYDRKEFELWKEITINKINLLSSYEKKHIIDGSAWNHDIYVYLLASLDDNTPNVLNENAYDAQLLLKGLLLNSETGLKELIYSTGNKRLIDDLNCLITIKKLIETSKSPSGIANLRKEYDETERRLSKESQIYGDYMDNLRLSYKDIKTNLNEGDIAIEFIARNNPTVISLDSISSSFDYYALCLRKGYEAPHAIKLCCEADLLRNSDSLYNFIWEPLKQEIEGIKNIYFAPIYTLNNLPIESAISPEGKTLSEMSYNLYRLSSKREIAKKRNPKAYKHAILYGGLDFDATIDSQSVSQNPADLSGEAEELFVEESRLLNDIKDRGIVWGYLDGTLSEVKKINDILKKNRIATVLYTDKNGTESSFKNLSGKDIDMIHIATHGFYVKNDAVQSEDRQMERSGLTFVGANNAKAREGSPSTVDNGILTAAEISRLDFRGVDLVVLSACQTGLGDVSSEGVWGLQRGLKKAGVQSILMTLWTVDDNATQLLMTEFYRNLVSGKSKLDALEQAKLFVRTYKDGRYADEKYWAGFILLDAIN